MVNIPGNLQSLHQHEERIRAQSLAAIATDAGLSDHMHAVHDALDHLTVLQQPYSILFVCVGNSVVYEQLLKKFSVKEGLGYLFLGVVYEGFKAKLNGGARPSAGLLGRSIECL